MVRQLESLNAKMLNKLQQTKRYYAHQDYKKLQEQYYNNSVNAWKQLEKSENENLNNVFHQCDRLLHRYSIDLAQLNKTIKSP